MTNTAPAPLPCSASCHHGVPSGCYCRWCTEGGQPSTSAEPTEAERDARRAAIRADWSQKLADMPARRSRRSR